MSSAAPATEGADGQQEADSQMTAAMDKLADELTGLGFSVKMFAGGTMPRMTVRTRSGGAQ
ncbi:MAG TPA: hypothetical protein VNF47_23175 [Streptosporangiaceae bacterium]|nr:hypothetical protein [Streptosporangiaceae bacterium]